MGVELHALVLRHFRAPRGQLCLYPVIAYWLTGARQRAPLPIICNGWKTSPRPGLTLPAERRNLRHFLRWRGDAGQAGRRRGEIATSRSSSSITAPIRRYKGDPQGSWCSVPSGDLELARALGRSLGQVTVNALVFTDHAERFNRLLQAVNPQANLCS